MKGFVEISQLKSKFVKESSMNKTATPTHPSWLSLLPMIGMCTLAVAIFFTLLVSGPAVKADPITSGDGNWIWESPLPQGNDLNSVSCTDSSNCWAVGVDGLILHYDGLNWNIASSKPTTSTLNSISCPSAAYCVAVGT